MKIHFKQPLFSVSPKWVLSGPTFKNTARVLAINLALASSVVAAPVQSSDKPVTGEPPPIETIIINAVPLVTDLHQTPEFLTERSQPDIERSQPDDHKLSGIASAAVAKRFFFQLINQDWSVRGNSPYLRSEPAVYAGLFVEGVRESLKVRLNWYQADGRLLQSEEGWIGQFNPAIGQRLPAETMGLPVVLGSYSTKVTVQEASGATLYEKQIDFEVIKKPSDPPGQYLDRKAMTSQDKPFGEEKTLFTFTDGQVLAALMFEYYRVEIDSAVGFKMEWYYDEMGSVYLPGLGSVSIPSPYRLSREIWTDEFEVGKFFYGFYDQLTLPGGINFLGTYLKGQWHVDFLIKMDRGHSEWQLVTSLPFTIYN
jgi:hypothetical protein